MKKIRLLLLLLLTSALLAGCAGNADNAQPSPSPNATGIIESVLPGATDRIGSSPMPDATDDPTMPGAGIETVQDAQTRSKAMEEAVEKLSEVDDAWVVATGHTALIGVEFTKQYQGQVDDRMKKMILSRVQTVEKGVTGVAVTADEMMVKRIQTLAENLRTAADLNAINSQAAELAKEITVYTE